MINEYEVPVFIVRQLPQIRQELTFDGRKPDVYRSLTALTDYTKRMAQPEGP